MSITEEMLELAFKISKSDDENDMMLRSGIPSIRYTYLTMLSFILDNQNNSSVYLTEDLERLTDSLSVSVLKNKEWMDASARKSLKHQIQRIVNNTSSEYISNKYNRLIETL